MYNKSISQQTDLMLRNKCLNSSFVNTPPISYIIHMHPSIAHVSISFCNMQNIILLKIVGISHTFASQILFIKGY